MLSFTYPHQNVTHALATSQNVSASNMQILKNKGIFTYESPLIFLHEQKYGNTPTLNSSKTL